MNDESPKSTKIDTGGGISIGADVNTSGGNFAGRDYVAIKEAGTVHVYPRKSEIAGAVWTAVIIATGIILAAFISTLLTYSESFKSPSFTPNAHIEISPTVAPSNSTETLPNWELTFQRSFQSGFWSIGIHTYTLRLHCTDGTMEVIRTHTFKVSPTALQQNAVYLRMDGIHGLSSSLIDTFHPADYSEVEVTFKNMTKFEAERKSQACKVFIGWDKSPIEELESPPNIGWESPA